MRTLVGINEEEEEEEVFLCNGIYNIALLSAVTEKRVSAAEAHKNMCLKLRNYSEI